MHVRIKKRTKKRKDKITKRRKSIPKKKRDRTKKNNNTTTKGNETREAKDGAYLMQPMLEELDECFGLEAVVGRRLERGAHFCLSDVARLRERKRR